MSDTTIPRMYGVTCPLPGHEGHVVREGKILLSPNAQVSDLKDALGVIPGTFENGQCPESGTGIQFSMDNVRFVENTEPPPYTEISPSLD
jgi:hypothetical protein